MVVTQAAHGEVESVRRYHIRDMATQDPLITEHGASGIIIDGMPRKPRMLIMEIKAQIQI